MVGVEGVVILGWAGAGVDLGGGGASTTGSVEVLGIVVRGAYIQPLELSMGKRIQEPSALRPFGEIFLPSGICAKAG